MIEVSVIIPTYGTPKYLKESINSVLNQTLGNWELIIVDDNNPATEARRDTKKIVEEFPDNRIIYIQHPHNLNGAAARNTALKVARGKYISFLDSDDLYMPNRLEKCLKAIENHKDFGGVYTGCEFRRYGSTYKLYDKVSSGNFLSETLSGTFMFCTGSNIFMRKDVINEIGGFDESFQRHQDYEFLVRFFNAYSLLALPELLVIKNNDNLNVPDVDKLYAIKQQYLGKYHGIIEKLSEDEQSRIYRAQYLNLATIASTQLQLKKAFKFYKQVSKFKRLSMAELAKAVFLPVFYAYKKYLKFGGTNLKD